MSNEYLQYIHLQVLTMFIHALHKINNNYIYHNVKNQKLCLCKINVYLKFLKIEF